MPTESEKPEVSQQRGNITLALLRNNVELLTNNLAVAGAEIDALKMENEKLKAQVEQLTPKADANPAPA